MLLNLDMQTLGLNINPNGQSPEKVMSFSSPVFVSLGFLRHKIENKQPDARNTQQITRRLKLITMNPSIPTDSDTTTRPSPDEEVWEEEQDNDGDGCEGQGM